MLIVFFVSSILLKYIGKYRKGIWNVVKKEVIIKVLLVLMGSLYYILVKWGFGN